jgi:hypothetical protein
MPTSLQALEILLVLLPGFLCAKIVQSLFVRPQQSELDKVIEALLFSFLIYVAFVVTFRGISLRNIDPLHLLYLTGYSIGLGVLIAAALTNDWFNCLLRWLKVTQRTSNASIWNDTFRHCGGYVLVELADERLVFGWVHWFSDRDEQASFFLKEAAWVNRDGSRIQIAGSGILLTRESGIRNVMFVDGEYLSEPKENAASASA